jgi:hypothetical protein
MIMRAILHDHAPSPYSGQWPEEKAAVCGLESPSIAHHELAASAGFATFDVPEGDFPGKSLAGRWKFLCRPKRKSARAAGAHPATTIPLTASIQGNSALGLRQTATAITGGCDG